VRQVLPATVFDQLPPPLPGVRQVLPATVFEQLQALRLPSTVLKTLVEGHSIVDPKDLRRRAILGDDVKDTDPDIRWLWLLLGCTPSSSSAEFEAEAEALEPLPEPLSNDEVLRFLRFVTGGSNVPPSGEPLGFRV
jgi:hypothetical protein